MRRFIGEISWNVGNARFQSRHTLAQWLRVPCARKNRDVVALSVQLLRHQFIQQRRVGLALRRLHHLAYKESRHRLLSGAILLHLLGIGGDNLRRS